ncbi:MAG: thioredoxin-disulfide reductase [Deferribacterota bacterium]|nr:thioredoxin-disulfide reductase [Deferribacterota bacterium]
MEDFFNLDNLKEKYDLVIIGAGPAGLTAAIYAGRDLLNTLVLEKNFPGGQVSSTEFIENYPGFPKGITGSELGNLFCEQAVRFGVQIKYGQCKKLEVKNNYKYIYIENDRLIKAKAVIIAGGSQPKHLGVPGEEKFYGRGVSFCATCDGAFYKNKTVAVVGGGDAAIQEGTYLTRFAERVYIIHRRDALRASKGLQEKAFKNNKITFIWNSVVKEIAGENKVEQLTLYDKVKDKQSNLDVDGVFIYIGRFAETEAYKDLLELDDEGFINADESTKTNIEGIYAAGDIRVRKSNINQIVTATADGAVSAKLAENYIDDFSEITVKK